MTPEQTPVELIAVDVAAELDRLLNEFLDRPGGDRESERRRAALKEFLWDNKAGCLRIAQAYGGLLADLRETLKATLHHCGPEKVHEITSHVLAAQKVRASNNEMDRLEKLFETV